MKITMSQKTSLILSKQDTLGFYDELRHILILSGDDLPVTRRVVELMEA